MKKKYFILLQLFTLLFLIDVANSNNLNNSKKNNEYKKYLKYNKMNDFDHHFIKYSKQYFSIAFEWKHFKSQAIAESNLNPNAKSPVGAEGIMQIMPATYREIRNKNSYIKGSVKDPKWAIPAGIYYDSTIYNKWSPKRTFQDRIDYMMASYNAGMGNIINAQKKCILPENDPQTWNCIYNTLIFITGKHSVETIGYVARIKTIKEALDER